MAINVIVIADAEELLEALAGIAGRRCEAFPSVVLHFEHHCLHVVVEYVKVGILGQSFVAQSLYLVLENGAGIVLEEVRECSLVSVEFLRQLGVCGKLFAS